MSLQYTELSNHSKEYFLKKYHKIIKKAIKKIQLQSQIVEDQITCLPKLSKEEIKKINES